MDHELKKAALLFLLKALTVLVVCAGLIFAACHAFATKPTVSTRAAMEILKSAPILFLATDRIFSAAARDGHTPARITTSIVVESVERCTISCACFRPSSRRFHLKSRLRR